MIEFEHPRLVWLAAAPLALWLFAFAVRAPSAPSGTVELWRELEAATPRSRRRTWTNWRLWCATLALVAGALALAAPLRRGALAPASWRILIDASPSMYLPWTAQDTAALRDGNAPTRLERALALAEPWLAERRAAGDSLTWTRWRAGAFEEVVAARCPDAWLRTPDAAGEPPPFERCDAPGWVWLTDDAHRAREPLAAGLFASGGAVVPGAIAETASEVLDWRGDELVPRPRAARGVRVDPACAAPLGELVAAWAAARGLEVGREPAVLRVETVQDGEATPAVGEQGGWSVRGEARPLALEADERAWLVDSGGERVLVAWRVGRVRLAFARLDVPDGDPALLAVAWSELFDRARLADPSVVALDERRAAGDELVREPGAPPKRDAAVEERWSFELALAAAFFTLLLLF